MTPRELLEETSGEGGREDHPLVAGEDAPVLAEVDLVLLPGEG